MVSSHRNWTFSVTAVRWLAERDILQARAARNAAGSAEAAQAPAACRSASRAICWNDTLSSIFPKCADICLACIAGDVLLPGMPRVELRVFRRTTRTPARRAKRHGVASGGMLEGARAGKRVAGCAIAVVAAVRQRHSGRGCICSAWRGSCHQRRLGGRRRLLLARPVAG